MSNNRVHTERKFTRWIIIHRHGEHRRSIGKLPLVSSKFKLPTHYTKACVTLQTVMEFLSINLYLMRSRKNSQHKI
jgi:hypothetical protein